MNPILLLAVAAASSPVLHYVRSNSDGSEREDVVVFTEEPGKVHVFKGRERCTRAAYVTARLDPVTGQARELTGGRLGRDLEQQPFAYFSNPPGRVQARLGSPDTDPVFDIAAGSDWFLYDFDFADWIANPPAAIREGRDYSREMILLLTPNDGEPSIANRGRFELQFGGKGTAADGEFFYYRAAGEALGGQSGEMWFDAADGRLLAARLPLANHAEYRDFAYTLTKREEGEAAWRTVLADHWAGCAPPED